MIIKKLRETTSEELNEMYKSHITSDFHAKNCHNTRHRPTSPDLVIFMGVFKLLTLHAIPSISQGPWPVTSEIVP